MITVIYQIYNFTNGHNYIGQTSQYNRRMIEHRSALNHGRHHSPYLQRAWIRYGEGQFIFRILEVINKDNATEREQWWIDLLCPQYNIGLCVDAPMKGRKHTEKAKKEIGNAVAGEKNPFYGKKHSAETIEKLREKGLKEGGRFKKGHKFSEETKTKISISCKGRPGPQFSQETLAKLSAQKMGVLNPNHERRESQKTKAKKSVSHRERHNTTPIEICYGEYVVNGKSMRQICRECNISMQTLSKDFKAIGVVIRKRD